MKLRIATKTTFVTTNEEAFKLFYVDCHLKNLRPHTIKYYRENLHYNRQSLVSLIERDLKRMTVGIHIIQVNEV